MTEPRIDYFLGDNQSAFAEALEKLRRENIVGRIWAKDHTVWKSSPVEISDRLDWLDAPQETLEKITYIRQSLEPLINSSIDNVVLLGMGGSILAAEVFNKIFGSEPGYPKLHIIDTTDPILISNLTKRLNLEKTLFLVSSKSGKTVEVVSLFYYFYNLVLKKLGNAAGSHFIIITDKGSSLEDLGSKLSLHHIFLSNSNIGGRYSALSITGIVPAAIIGIDVEILLLSAIDAQQREKVENFSGEITATGSVLGAVMGTLALKGRNKITFIMSSQWVSFGDWLEQLIAESTGKEGKGILPVLDEPLADPHVYSNDRLFVIFQSAQGDNTERINGLIEAGHPVITITTNNRYDLGGLMFLWEMATAVAGHFLDINPFDQPDVEITKAHMRRMIALYREHKELPYELPSLTTPECVIYGGPQAPNPVDKLNLFLSEANKDDYVCLQVYLNQSPEIDETIKTLRGKIFIKYGLAVTTGYGPRYLHSTGQLHKGDSGKGLFIQLTQENFWDVDIPDEIGKKNSSLTFGTLHAAQAQGDWQALKDAGRKIIRFHFRTNPVAGLQNLIKII